MSSSTTPHNITLLSNLYHPQVGEGQLFFLKKKNTEFHTFFYLSNIVKNSKGKPRNFLGTLEENTKLKNIFNIKEDEDIVNVLIEKCVFSFSPLSSSSKKNEKSIFLIVYLKESVFKEENVGKYYIYQKKMEYILNYNEKEIEGKYNKIFLLIYVRYPIF